ncbi:NnrS family protein [Pyxidicoccus fallax]|uniref:NnrS family protein n=1 Tax=Pyxidicoccus fallax TaxID=394095 RepID=A0A848LNB3_9BACT|nr:NnrS family protein [Pyxidicoccus fallax]NMO19054.1 NnrS family protein [Pyxidicoccus fallax]NPC82113.1 NnrS family protein [Pyxidicoccus fallax]
MTASLSAERPVPVWRREPYRLFFPLGVVLGQVGVLPWLLYALGLASAWRSTTHALTLVQGFMLCFALGFLYTFIPRRTGTEGPSAARVGISLLLPVAVTASAWWEAWWLAEAFFLAQLGVLLSFVVPRILAPGPGRTVPEGMVWVPMALGLGAAGAVLTAVPPGMGPRWLHALGTGLLLQGLFAGLVLGVGGMLLPMFLHGEPPGADAGTRRRLKQGLHVAAALAFVASFFLEPLVSSRWGHALRAVVVAVALVGPTRLWRPPTQAGLHRWLIWASAWLLPLGYLVVALRPELRTAGLHVVFLGCFGLMALAVSTHVVLAHGGHGRLLMGRPWQVGTVGALMGVAMVSRLLVPFTSAHFTLWLGLAAGAFLTATALWALFLVPLTRGAPTPHA